MPSAWNRSTDERPMPYAEDSRPRAMSADPLARRFKPWLARYIAWGFPTALEQDPAPDADAEWTTSGRHWRTQALLSWIISLVVAAAWFAVLMFLWKRSEPWRGAYFHGCVAWLGLAVGFYQWGWRRNRRRRLKPSPFFFWFDGR